MDRRYRLDHWIFHSFDPSLRALGLYRIAYALFTLLFVAPAHSPYARFDTIATFPDVFFLPPPGPMQLFPGFPSALFFEGLQIALLAALVALLFGYRTFWASLLVGVLFFVGYGFSYSFGKINHSVLFLLLPLVMACSNWGARYSLDALYGRARPTRDASWTLTLLALLVGFAFFTAGFAKLIGGWLDPATRGTLGHFVRQFFVHGRQDFLAPYFITCDSVLLWEALDYATVFFELGFLLAIVHPVTTRWFMGLAVCFHFGTMLMLNIAFAPNLIVYAAFFDWDAVSGTLSRWRLDRAGTWLVAHGRVIPAFFAGLVVYFYVLGSPLLFLDGLFSFTSDLAPPDVLAVFIAFLVVVAAALGAFWRRLRRPALT